MTTRTNLAIDPRATTTAWFGWNGGSQAATFLTTGGPFAVSKSFARYTFTGTVAVGGGIIMGTNSTNRCPVVAATTYTASMYVRSSVAQRLQLQLVWYTSAGALITTSTTATPVVVLANTWTRIAYTLAAPATAAYASIQALSVSGTGLVSYVSGNTIDGTGAQMETGSSLGSYFDGSTQTPGFMAAWNGTANASTSVSTDATIVATADGANGRVALALTGVGTVYVYRRDADGVEVVRQATEGYALTAGTPATIYDYEPQQGASSDYILADAAGYSPADTNLTVPKWGTWLKSPLRPWLNVLTALNSLGDVERQQPREVAWVEGARYATVLTEERHGPTGQVTLAVRTAAELEDLNDLLQTGGTLLLDAAPEWAVPYRYVNVGNTVERRLWSDQGLDRSLRTLVLQDVLAANPPTGPLDINLMTTYDTVATDYPSYAAIPVLVASYNALAVA